MHWIKLFMIPWYFILVLFVVIPQTSSSCTQQKRNAFQFQLLGHSRTKNKCYQRCCQNKRCQLPIFSADTKKCYGVTCGHKQLCHFIGNQLKGFAGHRVDKRSLDSQIGQTESREEDLDNDDNDIDDSDFGEDVLKEMNTEDANKRRNIIDDTPSDQESDEVFNTEEIRSCPAARFHQTLIPNRRRGFKFHRFHGHSTSLGDCSRKCCDKENCILPFHLMSSCFGILCDDDSRSCHTKKDHLPELSLFFTRMKDTIPIEPSYHHQRKLEEHTSDRLNSVNNPEERHYSHHNEDEQELLKGLEKTSLENEFVTQSNRHLHNHHRHHNVAKEEATVYTRASNPAKSVFRYRSHHHHHHHHKPLEDADNIGEDDQPTMVLPDSNKHHDYSGMDMHDDLQLLSKNRNSFSEQESIGATLSQGKHGIEEISGEGSGDSGIDRTSNVTNSTNRKHTGKAFHTSKKTVMKSSKEIEMSKKIKLLEDQLKKNGAVVNTTNFYNPNDFESGSGSFVSGSGSIDDEENGPASRKQKTIAGNKKTSKGKSEDEASKRNEIMKPKNKIEKEHYGHKEDIFKEFEKTKHKSHKEKVLKEVNRLKELESEIKKQEAVVQNGDEDGSSDSEGSGNLMRIPTTTTTTVKPILTHRKKKKKKPKRLLIIPKTTRTTTSTTPTTTTSPTTTTATTSTMREPHKVVAVLKYQNHTPRPTKPIVKTRNHTVHNRPTPHPRTHTTSSPILTTVKTTHQPYTTQKKTTLPTTTATTTTTTTTPVTRRKTTVYVVPTVPVDTADEQKPNDHTTRKISTTHSLNYNEEEKLQDLSKTKTMHPVKPKIPSLNINVGDDDVDSENQPASSKPSKEIPQNNLKNANTPKQNQKSIQTKNDFKQGKNKDSLTRGKLQTTRKKTTTVHTTTTTSTVHTTTRPTTTTTTTQINTQVPKEKDFRENSFHPYGYPSYDEDDRSSSYAYPDNQKQEYPSRYGDYLQPPMFSRYHDDYNEYRGPPPYPTWRSPEKGSDEKNLQRDQPGFAGNPLDPSFNPYNLGFDPNKGASLHGGNNQEGRMSAPNQVNATQNHGEVLQDQGRAPIHNQGDSPPEPYIIQQSHGKDNKEKQQNLEELPKATQDGAHHTGQDLQNKVNGTSQHLDIGGTSQHLDMGVTSAEIHKANNTTNKEKPVHNKKPTVDENEHTTNNQTKTRTQISQKISTKPVNRTQAIASTQDTYKFIHKNAPTAKESPQETINRILGGVNHILNQTKSDNKSTVENADKKHKPLDTIHNILGSSLDMFLKDSEVKYNHTHQGIETGKSMTTNRKNRLDEFFKKAQITTHENKIGKNISSIQGVKKNHVETGPIKHKNETVKENKEMVSANVKHDVRRNETLRHFKGCAVKKDLPSYTFQNIDHVGYKYKMTQLMDVNDCLMNCCQHDTCHVAYHEDQTCYLLQCSDRNLCDAVTRASKQSRIIYLTKPAATRNSKPQFCLKQNSGGIVWQQTPTNFNTTQPCPREASGEAKRMCDTHSRWLPPDFSECVSKEYAQIMDKTKRLGYSLSATDLIEELEQVTSETIDNSLIFGGNLKMATESLLHISNFLKNNQKEDFNEKGLKGATKIISNLLDDANINEWNNIKENQNQNKLMQSLDAIGIYATRKLPRDNDIKTIVTRSLLTSIGKVTLENKKQLQQPKQKQAKLIAPKPKQHSFPDYSRVDSDWTRKKDSISLPKNLFLKDRPTMVSSVIYKTLSPLLPHRWKSQKFVTFTDGFVVNSNILSCVVEPKPLRVLTPPVTIILHHLKEQRLDRSKCVWWDFNNSGGSWSTEGCQVVNSNRTMTICQCNHLTHFAVLSNTKEQRISAEEEIKEHTMAIMWLGIPLMVVITLGVLYTCFSWSKSPKKSQVVILDKKPVLPKDDVFTTHEVSQRYRGSPKKNLYAVNRHRIYNHICWKNPDGHTAKTSPKPAENSMRRNIYAANNQVSHNTPSPSDLEWEHAWDCLTNSEFDTRNTKRLHEEFKRQLLKNKIIRQQRYLRRKNLSESSSSSSTDAISETCHQEHNLGGVYERYFRWRADEKNDWSKERINYKVIKEEKRNSTMVPDQVQIKATHEQNQQLSPNHHQPIKTIDKGSHHPNFSPDAISSPHSVNEFPVGQTPVNLYIGQNLTNSKRYLQISFDALDTCTDSTLDSINQIASDIETNYDDILLKTQKRLRYQPMHHQKMADVSIYIESDKSTVPRPQVRVNYAESSEDTGYQTSHYGYSSNSENDRSNEQIKPSKYFRDHIFTRLSFQGFPCNEFCCMTYIEQLFVSSETDIQSLPGCRVEVMGVSISDASTDEEVDHKKRFYNYKQSKTKRSKLTSVQPLTTMKPLRKLMLDNTTVAASGCRVKRYNARESKVSPTQSANRNQTRHMKSYIALRQQCRLNDDLSPLSKHKVLIPNLKSPLETAGAIRKSKLKRKKAFKVLNETDNIGKARQRIMRRENQDKRTLQRIDMSSDSSSTSSANTSWDSLIQTYQLSEESSFESHEIELECNSKFGDW